MESLKMIEALNGIPKSKNSQEITTMKKMFGKLQELTNRDIVVQASIYSSIIGYQVLETRNIPDNLFEAYASQYPRMSEGISLYDKYLEVLDRGENSVKGLVNGVKGKFFEFHVEENLSLQYPEYNFLISKKANQAIWDIKGVDVSGEEFFIQVKMMEPSQAMPLSRIMEDNPDVYYATSTEIRERILTKKPELANQFVPVDVSSYEFTEDVKEGLETLKENFGIDVPDEVFLLTPYTTEIILGIRLIFDIASVKRDFKQIKMTDKSRLAGVKVLILFSRFGINTILGVAGSALGTAIVPGFGTVVGGLSGAVAGSILNKQIAPYVLEIAYHLLGLNEEDVFYFKNINKIHNLALEYRNNKVILEDHKFL